VLTCEFSSALSARRNSAESRDKEIDIRSLRREILLPVLRFVCALRIASS
jgi:hypothetical protein